MDRAADVLLQRREVQLLPEPEPELLCQRESHLKWFKAPGGSEAGPGLGLRGVTGSSCEDLVLSPGLFPLQVFEVQYIVYSSGLNMYNLYAPCPGGVHQRVR